MEMKPIGLWIICEEELLMDMKPFMLRNFVEVACGKTGWELYTFSGTHQQFAKSHNMTISQVNTLGSKVLRRRRQFEYCKRHTLSRALFTAQVYYYAYTIDIPNNARGKVAHIVIRRYTTAESFLRAGTDDFRQIRNVGKTYADYLTILQRQIMQAGYASDPKCKLSLAE